MDPDRESESSLMRATTLNRSSTYRNMQKFVVV
jgi:hypothetical protein